MDLYVHFEVITQEKNLHENLEKSKRRARKQRKQEEILYNNLKWQQWER